MAIFAVQKNGVEVGTMMFAAAATSANFAMASPTTFDTGDVLTWWLRQHRTPPSLIWHGRL